MAERYITRLHKEQGPRIDDLAQNLSARFGVPRICVDSIALDLGKKPITTFLRPLLENRVRNVSKEKPFIQSEVGVYLR